MREDGIYYTREVETWSDKITFVNADVGRHHSNVRLLNAYYVSLGRTRVYNRQSSYTLHTHTHMNDVIRVLNGIIYCTIHYLFIYTHFDVRSLHFTSHRSARRWAHWTTKPNLLFWLRAWNSFHFIHVSLGPLGNILRFVASNEMKRERKKEII